MKFNQSFEIARPIERVWKLFEDVPQVVECLPGATLEEDLGGDRFRGNVAVKIGPVKANFAGEAAHTADAASRSGTIEGKGADKKGGSRGQVKIQYRLEEAEGGGTRVHVDSDITLAGRAAQFGRPGLVKEMTGRLMTEFGEALEGRLSSADAGGDAAAEPAESGAPAPRESVSGLSLLFGSLWSMLKNALRGLFGRS